MAFSTRSGFDRRPNELARWLAKRPLPDIDLTESNPTRCGLTQPGRVALLGHPRAARYLPASRGGRGAREAVARYYQRRGVQVDPEQVVLTASSSEAYSWLFKLLCEPGDQVLAPRPGYPLFPFLARLEEVELRSYRLAAEEHWRIDRADFEQVCSQAPRARAVIAVSPANPTGQYLSADDQAWLLRRCGETRSSLVVDEVFHDYPLEGPASRSFAAEPEVDTFVLGGLSKAALLPQLKLGWMVVAGPNREEALARLELMGDSYLSVSSPVQEAAPTILDGVDGLQAEVVARLRTNLQALDGAIAACGETCPVRRRRVEGGWYVLVEIPRTRSDDEWVKQLVEQAAIWTQPGYFYDLESEGVMIVSLLLEPERFRPAIEHAVACWSAG